MADPWTAFQSPTTVSRRASAAPFTYGGQKKKSDSEKKDTKKKKTGDGQNPIVVFAIEATLWGLAGLGAFTLWSRRR